MKTNIAYNLIRFLVRLYAGLMLNASVQQPLTLPRGAKILAANHPTTLDPFYLEAFWPETFYVLAHIELFTVPLVRRYFQFGNHIPVDPANGMDAFQQARRQLEKGDTILIFPEGRISSQPGKFYPFRSGTVRLAMLTGAPVIPIGLYAPRKIPLWRCQNCYLRGKYGVTVGQPLCFDGKTHNKAHVTAFTLELQHTISRLIRQSRRRVKFGVNNRQRNKNYE